MLLQKRHKTYSQFDPELPGCRRGSVRIEDVVSGPAVFPFRTRQNIVAEAPGGESYVRHWREKDAHVVRALKK